MKTTELKRQLGFTLIELVMVIVLLGILSFGGISLFTSQSAYAGFVAKDLLISQSLLAQQIALGSSGVANPASLTVSVDTDDNWVFNLQKAGVTNPGPVIVEASGNSLTVDGVAFTASSTQTFTWTNGAVLSPATNHEFRFSGQNSFRVCLSAQGYAYESSTACP